MRNLKAHCCAIISEEIMKKFLADLNLHPLSLGCCLFVVYRFWQAKDHLEYLTVLKHEENMMKYIWKKMEATSNLLLIL